MGLQIALSNEVNICEPWRLLFQIVKIKVEMQKLEEVRVKILLCVQVIT